MGTPINPPIPCLTRPSLPPTFALTPLSRAVVFFGDNLPPARAARAARLAAAADALLVVGTSLATLSSFRVAAAVAARGRPVLLLGLGPTRGDGLASAIKARRVCSIRVCFILYASLHRHVWCVEYIPNAFLA